MMLNDFKCFQTNSNDSKRFQVLQIIYRLPPLPPSYEKKIDVEGLQNSTFGGGRTRFVCLERPGPGFSLIFIDFNCFLLIFIDFDEFGRHPKPGCLPAWLRLAQLEPPDHKGVLPL